LVCSAISAVGTMTHTCFRSIPPLNVFPGEIDNDAGLAQARRMCDELALTTGFVCRDGPADSILLVFPKCASHGYSSSLAIGEKSALGLSTSSRLYDASTIRT